MNTKTLKAIVKRWAKKVGRETAIARLLLTGKVSVSTAEQLIDGRYVSSPREKLITVLGEELAKDGFSFFEEKAS